MRGAHSIILSPYIFLCPSFSLHLSAPRQGGGTRREKEREWVREGEGEEGEMDRLGDSDKRSIPRPNSPGRSFSPLPSSTPSSLQFFFSFSFFSLFSPHFSFFTPLFFHPHLCSLQTDKGSFRMHFVWISVCLCVCLCTHTFACLASW